MNLNFVWLWMAICTSSFASYVVTPLIPIYCVELTEHGGLGWSRADAFSLFGTFLIVLYTSPSLVGLLGDRLCGRRSLTLGGYTLLALGLLLLAGSSSYCAVCAALMAIGCGIGVVKVSLHALTGRLPSLVRQRGYEYIYVAACLGFVLGGLLSGVLFVTCGMYGVTITSFSFLVVSSGCFCRYSSCVADEVYASPIDEQTIASQSRLSFFIALLVLGLPFFICSNQLVTGMPVFLHQCVDRKVGSWSMPALWFGVIGSMTMVVLSPLIRRAWNRWGRLSGVEPLKCGVGFCLMATSFACASVAALSGQIDGVIMILLFVGLHALCHIADFHVRPVLLAAATTYTPVRYHTLCTALVYVCIGLGGKLAGTLASFVDEIGFSGVFGTSAALAAFCGCLAIIWWKYRQPMHVPESASIE
jgi:POT family proton-dependent oligopeptide transporter